MSWANIRGQDAAVHMFQGAALRGRLGQGYLLAGPEGVGKRRFAWELAKALLCERPPAVLTACDHCPACAQVMAETHPDVLALRTPEDKHELPVEEMREFCAQLSFKPVRGGRKVGIVEDADDFNAESANSFLKTLEEPPPGAMLLLVATSADRQLPTILSRCQVVRFARLGPADLSAVLSEAGVNEPRQRERLVKLAGGSVSRALSLNDERTWLVRDELLRGIMSGRANFVQLQKTWWGYVESAAKETAPQRLRMAATIGFLVDALRLALHMTLGAAVSGLDPAEEPLIRGFANRTGPDQLQEMIEKCVEADYQVDRRVQLILVIESLLHFLLK